MNDLINVSIEDIILTFECDGKKYCALKNSESESDDNIYFAQISNVVENKYVLTSVLDSDRDKVISEFEKQETIEDILEYVRGEIDKYE